MLMRLLAVMMLAGSLALGACGGGGSDGEDGDETPAARATAVRTSTAATEATPAAGVTELAPTAQPGTPGTEATSAPNPAPQAPPGAPSNNGAPSSGNAPPPPPPPAAPVGRMYTATEAQTLVQSVPLQPGDVGGGWGVLTDAITDNAAAAATDPGGGASFERCGRLSGRTLALQPAADQLATRYFAGQSVAFFTNMTVYATEAGAIDCANEAAARLGSCADLARAFGSLFVDPNAVTCAPADFAQVGDGSIAGTLTGKVLAGGIEVDLTVLAVAFREGNVGVIAGSAAASAPSTAELAPLIDRIVSRIAAAQ